MAIGDEDYYVMTGKGLESSLTPSMIGDIFDDYTEDYFARGNYDACARMTVQQLTEKLVSIYQMNHGGGGGNGNPPTPGDIFLEILGLLFVILIGYLIIRLFIAILRPRTYVSNYNNRRYTLNHSTPYYRRARRVYYTPPTYHSTWPSGSGTYHSGSSYHSSSSSSSSSHSSSSYHSSSSHSSSSSRPSMPSGGSSRGSGSGRHG
ncbi:MAG: TPM domain-containing protein, partial [Erysipelotrichaceae bacterium]|nr:TPM domain-containing protein [Erysipelotrichaceae bacterium]